MSAIKTRVLIELRRFAEFYARASLKRNRALWQALQDYIRQSSSTGCNFSDYWNLYNYIKRHRPREILECGTGVSTLVIATALAENDLETGVKGRVTSMEEHPQWLETSKNLLAQELHQYVDFRLSPIVEDYFSLFRGIRYRDTPARDYDFVFVDGPSYRAPSDGAMTFDFDIVHVLRHAEKPVAGLIDKRVSTCYALQQLLGCEKVHYSPIVHLGFVKSSTRKDLREIPLETPSRTFSPSFRVLSRTRLALSVPIGEQRSGKPS